MSNSATAQDFEASIIIPAHNEAAYIGACLTALLEPTNTAAARRVDVIVIANACDDDTGDVARSYQAKAHAIGWQLSVLDCPQPGKPHALNAGDRAARGAVRIYLDADVRVSRDLVADLIAALARPGAAYAAGTPVVGAPPSLWQRAYARFWASLPFVSEGVPGFGIFAVNAAGRARWQDFPDIISDDTFVRLCFAPSERIRVAARYGWPMVAGFANLVRVRRRQDRGVREIAALYPELTRNEARRRIGFGDLLRRLLQDPVGFATYGVVSLAVRSPLFHNAQGWVRGR